MNNTSRTITFILLSAIVMMVAITMQNRMFPPKKLPGADNVAKQDAPEKKEPATEDAEKKLADAQDNKQVDPQSEVKPAPANEDAPKIEPGDPTSDDAPEKKQEVVEEPAVVHPHILTTLGSLDPAAGQRFLITLNSKGGAIKRIESATRKKNGRYLYRDLETEGGYWGSLDCIDTPDGCRVQIVGPGTPAETAGIKTDDVIKSIGGRPVGSVNDLKTMLSKTKRKQTVNVVVARGSGPDQQQLDLAITLTEKPLEFLRPETAISDGSVLPESFLLTLFKADSNDKWIEIDQDLKNKDWKIEETTRDGLRVIEFSFDIPKSKLAALGLDGPLTVIKRYWLEPVSAEALANLNSHSWHFKFEMEIQNKAAKPVAFGYELDGPTGATTEGWWYQMKINGGGSFTAIAGARDVVGDSSGKGYVFHGGPGLVTNLQKDPLRQQPKEIVKPYTDPEERILNYMGVDTQYFNISMFPDQTEENPFICDGALAWPTAKTFPKNSRLHRLVDCTGVLLKKVTLKPNKGYRQSFTIFTGPKEPLLLDEYGLGDNRAFGWFGLFSKFLVWMLEVLYFLTFKISYAVPIILLTMIVRSMMIPISRKAALNAQMMQHLSPMMKEIKQKYPDDMQKQSQAQRELFKKYKYNPFSGCLMGFIQLPIFIGLYRGLSVDIALRDQPLIPGVSWCSNLAAPDQLLNWQSWMPEFLGSETGWLGPYLNVLPLITIVLFVANAKLFTPPPTDDQQAMMQKVMTYMMFFMGFLFFKVPAALCLYFITSSIWGIIERKMLPKPVLDTDSLPGMDGEIVAKVVSKKKSADLVDPKEIEERRRRDRERKKRLKEREN